MKETLVSFETAKLLNDKEFKEVRCLSVFVNEELEDFPEGELYSNSDLQSEWFKNNHNYNVVVPTQSLAQKWLREVHKIHIAILPKMLPSNEIKYYIFKGKIKTNWIDLYDTYEEALENGLLNALQALN